ncbi:hypothetical protein GFL95_17005 [Rhizobium leguminosarum bv. viciae]|uniref:DUF6173 family protein n=1 Tax=Rhizobium leguminosarum TaxID=384 RepID=UPI00144227AE|nr:DUF6173 family protein [Rhizobium leguminosarum]NKK92915.1 hypothetical protein [Rhizobium leguminosarum bv. viciae]
MIKAFDGLPHGRDQVVTNVTFEPLPRLSPETSRILDMHPAEWMYERLAKSIIAFEESLDPDQEVGARLVNFSATEVISIDNVGYWGTDLIIFYGRTSDGRKAELLQHITQVNVLLVAVRVEKEEVRRIGFILKQKLENDSSE